MTVTGKTTMTTTTKNINDKSNTKYVFFIRRIRRKTDWFKSSKKILILLLISTHLETYSKKNLFSTYMVEKPGPNAKALNRS